jgi:integrase
VAVTPRQVKNKRDTNGALTGRAGTVYDVNIKYKTPEGYKSYVKKGFSTKKDALQHEAEMRSKLINPSFITTVAGQGKQTVRDYLLEWVENHGTVNLRPSTFAGYKSNINNHIIPNIGHIKICQLTPAILDNMFQKLFDKGLSQSSVRYCHRIMSVALEAARKYNYIENNPAHDIITKFGKQGKTPDPYNIQQMQKFIGSILGTEWEMIVMLGGMYGLRISEILGLRWNNVDMKKGTFNVIEQLPYRLPAGQLTLPEELAPVKSHDRLLPITDVTRPYFERQLDLQARQKKLSKLSGTEYYDNRLVVAKPNGIPYRRETVSSDFGHLIKRFGLHHIRFHDLRHAAATNMHQLTGDFYTVGQILGHSLKGVGMQLGISTSLDSVTAQYVDVRLDRKKAVLNTYHNAVHPIEKNEVVKNTHKKSRDRKR